MTLALLLTAVGGAWAQATFGVKEITPDMVPDSWNGDNSEVTAADLANWGFKEVTEAEAKTWTGAPQQVTARLIYTISSGCESLDWEGGVQNGGSSYIRHNVIYLLVRNPDYSSQYDFFITTEPTTEETTNAEAPIKVTTNAAEEGATFTEATFAMPAFDATVDYELVRDMSVQMTAQVGDDATKEPRYRVQWNGESWVPADMTQQQVAALFSVNDLVENTTLDPKNYFVSIYAVNEQGETTGNPMTFLNFTFAPGRYAVTASAILGSPTYEGTTAPSNIFELFQGYEVEIAANSFATYYKDEALTIDESTAKDAALYTIREVTATEAVLSSEIEAAPSSTPLLVFNGSDKARTILLIPTNEPNLALTVAPEFMGTATGETFSEANMEAANFYVLTDANAFVWVKGAGQIAANKCWLQIEKTAPNNTRAIVFGEDATSINEELRVKNEESAGAVFDLSGRKVANGKWLNGKLPNGVYIINGKKMVVK